MSRPTLAEALAQAPDDAFLSDAASSGFRPSTPPPLSHLLTSPATPPTTAAPAAPLTPLTPLRATNPASPEGGIVRLSPLASISAYIAKPAVRSKTGLPTVLAVYAAAHPPPDSSAPPSHLAVGSTHGLVLVFCYADAPDAASSAPVQGERVGGTKKKKKRGYALATVLGSLNSGPGVAYGPVTAVAGALDAPAAPHVVAVGHASGSLVLWDGDAGKVLKVVTTDTVSPIVHLSLPPALAGTAVLWGDGTGSLTLTTVTKSLLSWKTASTQLVDGAAQGAILDLRLLAPAPAGAAVYAVSTASTATVISLAPTVAVLAKLPIAAPSDGGVHVAWCGSWSERETPLLACASGSVVVLSQLTLPAGLPAALRQTNLHTGTPIADLHFMSPSVLAVLTAGGSLTFLDPHTLNSLEALDVTHLDLAFDSRSAASLSYAPCFAVHGRVAYLLGIDSLYRAMVLTWSERVRALVRTGKFVDAVDLATAMYNGTAPAVVGLPGPPGSPPAKAAVAALLTHVLVTYVDIFVQSDAPSGGDTLAAVIALCVDTALLIGAENTLLPQLYEAFGRAAGARPLFLHTLEPYLLDSRLRSLAPVLMHDFVETYAAEGNVRVVSRCILNMDLASLDFHQVVTLCREAALWEALIYVFTRGLGDYVAPLDDMMDAWLAPDAAPDSDVGYKILLYLSYTLLGKAFPSGNIPAEHDVADVKSRVLGWVLTPRPSVAPLRDLLLLDVRESLRVIGLGLDAFDARTLVLALLETVVAGTHGWKVLAADGSKSAPEPPAHDAAPGFDVAHVVAVYAWIARAAASSAVAISPTFVDYLSVYTVAHLDADAGVARAQTMALVALVNAEIERAGHGETGVLTALVAAARAQPLAERFGPLKRGATRAKAYPLLEVLARLDGDVGGVFDAYLNDAYRAHQVFDVMRATLDGAASDEEMKAAKSEVLARLHPLIALDSAAASSLVVDHLGEEHEAVVASLEPYPRLLFDYLAALLDGPSPMLGDGRGGRGEETALVAVGEPGTSGTFEMPVGARRSRSRARVVVDDGAFLASLEEKYIALMAAYSPGSVLAFVQAHDAYRLDVVLAVCSEYSVVDATAYLLERTGDSAGAIELIMESFDDALSAGDEDGLAAMFRMAIGVCQRTTEREADDEGSRALWFALLDRTLEPADGDDVAGLRRMMHLILNGMSGYVSLPSLLAKILRDHGDRQYGEFKDVIMGILSTYRYESLLLKTTNHILADDCFSYVRTLRTTLDSAFAGRRGVCALCSGSLRTASPEAVVKLFKCGHELHQQCGFGLDECPECSGGSGFSAESTGSAELRRRRDRDALGSAESRVRSEEYVARVKKWAAAQRAQRAELGSVVAPGTAFEVGRAVAVGSLALAPPNRRGLATTGGLQLNAVRVPGSLGPPMHFAKAPEPLF